MKKRFLGMFVAKLEDEFRIENDVLDVRVEPVYENGMKFSGQVFVSGDIMVDVSEDDALEVVANYLRKHVDFVKPVALEFRNQIENTQRRRWAS